MIAIFAYFAGIFGAVWVISLILTFIWRKCTKREITHRAIVVSTMIAAVIWFLVSSAFTIDLMEAILIIIAVPCVLLIRFPKNEKKERQKLTLK